MIEWFVAGGFPMWFVLGSGLAGVVLAIDAGRKLVRDTPEGAGVRAEIDGVLFWGGFASVLGVVGTLVGVALVARALEQQPDAASLHLVVQGIRVALIPTVFGLAVLLACGLSWYGLRTALRRAETP